MKGKITNFHRGGFATCYFSGAKGTLWKEDITGTVEFTEQYTVSNL
jgi:hypothetical protein